jgi:prepilin-type N-terminal cleavage/methylation domain-containing protein
MNKAFTLIELIFVIVIIGLLSAIAIPKFLHLKEHATVNTIIKTTFDGAKKAVEAAENEEYLENNTTYTLKDLINLEGKGWKYNASYENGDYYYPNKDNKSIADIILERDKREILYRVRCNAFDTQTEVDICEKFIPPSDSVSDPYPYIVITY